MILATYNEEPPDVWPGGIYELYDLYEFNSGVPTGPHPSDDDPDGSEYEASTINFQRALQAWLRKQLPALRLPALLEQFAHPEDRAIFLEAALLEAFDNVDGAAVDQTWKEIRAYVALLKVETSRQVVP